MRNQAGERPRSPAGSRGRKRDAARNRTSRGRSGAAFSSPCHCLPLTVTVPPPPLRLGQESTEGLSPKRTVRPIEKRVALGELTGPHPHVAAQLERCPSMTRFKGLHSLRCQ